MTRRKAKRDPFPACGCGAPSSCVRFSIGVPGSALYECRACRDAREDRECGCCDCRGSSRAGVRCAPCSGTGRNPNARGVDCGHDEGGADPAACARCVADAAPLPLSASARCEHEECGALPGWKCDKVNP